MNEILEFALKNIYCAPSQDRQFNFSLYRVNRPNLPPKRFVRVYETVKDLPDQDNHYQVFVIGNLYPEFINLLSQGKNWFRDVWINASEDMQARNYILQVYNDDGVMYPRENIYYSFIDENSVVIALKTTRTLNYKFDTASFKYLRVYSNSYFASSEFLLSPIQYGIKNETNYVASNVDKVAIQTKINNYQLQGGSTFIYVNGYYTDNLNLNIPDDSFVEFVYDQSVLSKEKYSISDLRTFDSTKDNKLKYLLYREKIIDRIQYEDDNEIYISNDNQLVTKGLYFYQHCDYTVRNVTDKDYSLYSTFVNNQAARLSELTTGSLNDKVLIIHTRKSGLDRSLVFSSLKLHELYKLPHDKQMDVILNTNYAITEFRAETLEDSGYFKIASAPKLSSITNTLISDALGYNGVTYYFGKTPTKVTSLDNSIDVPSVYQSPSTAYEYDASGLMTGQYPTVGPVYSTMKETTKFVEFIKGRSPALPDPYYNNDSSFTCRDIEFRLVSAFFEGNIRISDWMDITDVTGKYIRNGNTITLTEDIGKKIKIVYFDQPNIYTLDLPIVDGVLYFPLSIYEDRGLGYENQPLDIPYTNIEVFLNENRLNYNLDFFMNFPNIAITNKTYIDYTKEKQSIHIRCHGFTLDKNDINAREIRGFVNNGTLTRNNYYDIRDDRVFSVFIRGRLYDRDNVYYSETDNTVRTANPLNGFPYTIVEPFIPIQELVSTSTLPLYVKNNAFDKKISDLFNVIFPEPTIGTFNVISDYHYIYSPVISKIIFDLLDGNISPTIYMSPYDDSVIISMLDTTYQLLYSMDPIKYLPEDNLVMIQPSIGNAQIAVNLFQFRFLTNVVRIVTNNKPDRINLSNYVNITTTV